jgi:nucleotide-binding universal stress UspA family protein
MSQILVCVDGDLSRAVRLIDSVVKTRLLTEGDRLVLLHVQPSFEAEELIAAIGVPGLFQAPVHALGELSEQTKTLFRGIHEHCSFLGIPDAQIQDSVLFGDQVSKLLNEAIDKIAQKEDCTTLVVVGNSCKGLVGRTLLGSVSESLLHSLQVPVMIIKLLY